MQRCYSAPPLPSSLLSNSLNNRPAIAPLQDERGENGKRWSKHLTRLRTDRPNKTFRRHNLDAVLPLLLRRVRAFKFTSHRDIAAAFSVDKATASRWKAKAIQRGLIGEREWRCALLAAQVKKARGAA